MSSVGRIVWCVTVAVGTSGGSALAGSDAARGAFKDAVAVWHFGDLNDSAGAGSVLKAAGAAKAGVALAGADRAASLARGGDGRAAVLSGGCFSAGQGAGGELNLAGRAMTMLIRLQETSGAWNTALFSKYGGHDRLVYNLFTHDFGDGGGMSIGFELGVQGRRGLGGQVKVPISVLGAKAWHDVIVRYDGKVLELFVDGVGVHSVRVSGPLRGGNTEPTVIGSHSMGGKLFPAFRGRIDHAALWSRAITDAQVVALSGGGFEVGKRAEAMAKRKEAVAMAKLAGLPKPVAAFRKVVKSKDVATFSAAALALRRWMIANDPHRPIYHFTGPESWINDPNGVTYHKGAYHLFYQFSPVVGRTRAKICWGHAVSSDLVHWKDWPVAIWPDTKYDRGGAYSGNMVIDDNGVPTALYTGNVAGHRETYGMQARSTDGFVTWQKKMVMDNRDRPNAASPVHWDGQIWKDAKTWYQLIGGAKDGRGAAWLWTSPDLTKWTLAKPIHSGAPGRYWELPYLVPLAGKYALMIGVGGNPYWIGSYDKKTMTFTPDRPQTRSADPGDYYSFNPHMTDDKGPAGTQRRLMHGWVRNPPSPTKTVPYWQGAHSIPRVITIAGGRLVQTPIPEIETLRGTKKSFSSLTVKPDSKGMLAGLSGDAIEIDVTFKPGKAKRFGVKVRASADGKTALPIWFDTASRQFGVADKRMTSDLEPGEPVRMRIFVDRSIVEVYVNGNAITKVAYLDPKARSVDLFAEGGNCTLVSLSAWPMASMWE